MEKAAGLARGYRCQLHTFFQDLNQLQDLYGKRWETFLANAGIIQAFTPNDLTTARYFSGLSGEGGQGRPLLSVGDIMGLDEGRQLIKRSGAAGLVEIPKTVDYYKNPEFAGMFDLDPYHG
jgi:type IV secretory pathway TraG/TraD family ATPase VirD4